MLGPGEEKKEDEPILGLRFTSSYIESVEFNSCDLNIELVETVYKFLSACVDTLASLTITRATPGHRADLELNLAIFKMLTDLSPSLNNLRSLDLSYNKIKDESTPDLCNFLQCVPPSLQVLNLMGADLKDKGLELLCK